MTSEEYDIWFYGRLYEISTSYQEDADELLTIVARFVYTLERLDLYDRYATPT